MVPRVTLVPVGDESFFIIWEAMITSTSARNLHIDHGHLEKGMEVHEIGDYSVSFQNIMEAEYYLGRIVHQTPLQHSHTFSQMTECSVYQKLENLQKTGAFKIRGAYNKVAHLSPEERARGIVTASAGNHAQGVSLAAHKFGCPATIVMPKGAPQSKIEATKGYGARVVLHGHNYNESYAKALEICEQEGATFVHAFDDPHVIAGQGTIGLEIVNELPYVDAIIVPVGGGGLISGIAIAAKTVNPEIKIIGVEPEGANSGYLSWKSNKMTTIENPNTIADGLSVKSLGRLPFELITSYVDDFVTVSDQQIEHAMYLFLERSKLLVEGAGACSLAGLLRLKDELKGKNVVLIVSGGNVDLSKLNTISHPRTATV